jgi:hypothetical protein
MKKRKEKYPNATQNVVYILGAGCSKEDKAPLIAEFFDKAFNEVKWKLTADQQERFNRVEDFRKNELPKSNVEELLSYIDLERVLNLKQRDTNLEDIRADLLYLIGKTIQELMGKGHSPYYDGFASANYWPVYTDSNLLDPVFISLNWDIALDNVLTLQDHENSPTFRHIKRIDYGSDFNSCIILNEDQEQIRIDETSRDGPMLLKLHGSMNWLFCKNQDCSSQNKKYFTYGEKAVVHVQESNKIICPACGQVLFPIIVPPTFNKLGDKEVLPLIRDIWFEAYKAIENAGNIIILGYSFPEDDVHFKLFFRSAIYANYLKSGKKTLNIDVVNYKLALREKMEFEDHYMRMITAPNVDIRPRFHYLKFSEFINTRFDYVTREIQKASL